MVDADTAHAGILFLGLWVIVDIGVNQKWPILLALGVLGAWTVGYWSVVKFVLPPSLSGQQNTPQ